MTTAPVPAGAPAAPVASPTPTFGDRLQRRPELLPLALLVATALVVGLLNPRFFQFATLLDLLHASTITGILACGVLVVLASGGIDVSFTAIAALTMYALTKAVFLWWPDAPFWLIALAGMLAGLALGCINGLLVHSLDAPPLIVTIGTLYLFRGILLTFIGTNFFMNIPHAMDAFGQWALIDLKTAEGLRVVLPVSFLILVAVASLSAWILNRTLIGRSVYALGGNPAIAARLGIDVFKVKLFVFGYAGLLAGLAGVLHVSNSRLANPFDLVGTELDVIAAVILGGARITGGTGTVTGTLLGVLLITLVKSVLILVGVSTTWQRVVVGGFILLAGILFVARRRNAQAAAF